MMKTVVAAAAVILPIVLAAPALAEPTPIVPVPPAASVDEAVASGPLGSTFDVRTGGDMAVTVRPSDAAVPPRADGQSVLVYEVAAEQTGGQPFFLPTLDMRMVMQDGAKVYPLTGVSGEYPSGFIAPGQPRSGLVAFGVNAGQVPKEVVFATADDVVQGAWRVG
ncbi:hypothetical protein [Nocardia sp. NPDC024068]|uniref:hypothetical protein n=1 Tax=Nocardia sp. NPDC024068 TaxID=3157197 RepID=UPI003405ADFB